MAAVHGFPHLNNVIFPLLQLLLICASVLHRIQFNCLEELLLCTRYHTP